MSTTIAPGEQVKTDPSDWTAMVFNWDEHLPVGAALTADAATAGAFTITCRNEDPVTMIMDEIAFVTGSSNRKVRFRVKGGTPGKVYNISHSIETTEVPAQKRDRSFNIWVKQH